MVDIESVSTQLSEQFLISQLSRFTVEPSWARTPEHQGSAGAEPEKGAGSDEKGGSLILLSALKAG